MNKGRMVSLALSGRGAAEAKPVKWGESWLAVVVLYLGLVSRTRHYLLRSGASGVPHLLHRATRNHQSHGQIFADLPLLLMSSGQSSLAL